MANILILDEETDSLKLLKRLLERNAHQVWAFARPAEALEWVAKSRLDLALVNVTSRRNSALAVLSELKRLNPRIKTMVIGDCMPEEMAEAVSADDFLVKPVDIDAVEKKVRELLKHQPRDLGSCTGRNYNITGSLDK